MKPSEVGRGLEALDSKLLEVFDVDETLTSQVGAFGGSITHPKSDPLLGSMSIDRDDEEDDKVGDLFAITRKVFPVSFSSRL